MRASLKIDKLKTQLQQIGPIGKQKTNTWAQGYKESPKESVNIWQEMRKNEDDKLIHDE